MPMEIRRYKIALGAGEMALWLRTLAALAGDLVSIPSSHMAANNHLDSSSRGPHTLFWHLQALHSTGALTYTKAMLSYA